MFQTTDGTNYLPATRILNTKQKFKFKVEGMVHVRDLPVKGLELR